MWIFTSVAVSVLVVFITRRVLRLGEGPLDTEVGRRRARQPHKKSASFYEMRGVTSTEGYFINSRRIELFTKQWLPLGGPTRAVVFYCHGFGGSCTHVFEEVAIRLAADHIAVVSMDYEGHGLSTGLHGYIRNFNHIVDDVIEFSATLRSMPDFAGLPFFLYGESMGGAVAIQVHRRQPGLWAGAILLAPMCKISDELVPSKHIVAMLKVLAFIFPTGKLVPVKDISDVAYRVPEKREVVRNNPVGYSENPRLRTAWEMMLATEDIRAHMHEVRLPLLVLHGAADVVTDPQNSKELVSRCSSADKALCLYEDAWHGLISGEPDDVAQRVIQDMIVWLRQRSQGGNLLPHSAAALGYGHLPAAAAYRRNERALSPADSQEDDAESSLTT